MVLGFRFARLSRIFRTDGADWAVGIVGAAGAAALLGADLVLRTGVFQLAMADTLVVIWCGLSGFFGVRSWRRLWRAGRTPPERVVYDLGVRSFGATMLLIAPVIAGGVMWHILNAAHESGAWMAAFVCAILSVLVTFPLSLWLGFAWGSMMSRVGWYGETQPGNRSGLPPAA
jgi:hypothetical protein